MEATMEALRRQLATEAAALPALNEECDRLEEIWRQSLAEEKERAAEVKQEIREQRKAMGAAFDRRVIARQAGKRLKVEFVDPELIRAEAARSQDVGQRELVRKTAAGDLLSVHQRIEGMRKRGIGLDTIEREERRASQVEMRVAAAVKARDEATEAHALALDAVGAAWDKAREVEIDGAEA